MKKINRSVAILTTAVVVCWSPIFAEVSDQEADVKNVVEAVSYTHLRAHET